MHRRLILPDGLRINVDTIHAYRKVPETAPGGTGLFTIQIATPSATGLIAGLRPHQADIWMAHLDSLCGQDCSPPAEVIFPKLPAPSEKKAARRKPVARVKRR